MPQSLITMDRTTKPKAVAISAMKQPQNKRFWCASMPADCSPLIMLPFPAVIPNKYGS